MLGIGSGSMPIWIQMIPRDKFWDIYPHDKFGDLDDTS
jgi:hypothetical protein